MSTSTSTSTSTTRLRSLRGQVVIDIGSSCRGGRASGGAQIEISVGDRGLAERLEQEVARSVGGAMGRSRGEPLDGVMVGSRRDATRAGSHLKESIVMIDLSSVGPRQLQGLVATVEEAGCLGIQLVWAARKGLPKEMERRVFEIMEEHRGTSSRCPVLLCRLFKPMDVWYFILGQERKVNCERVRVVLNGMLGGRMHADPIEAKELAKQHLLVAIRADLVKILQDLRDVSNRHNRGGGFLLDRRWVEKVLPDLEANLRSEMKRAFTKEATLRQQERDRVALRRCLGVLSDPALVSDLQQTAMVLEQVVPRSPFLCCPGTNRPAYGVTHYGARALPYLQAMTSGELQMPIHVFLRGFAKKDAATDRVAAQMDALERGVGHVPKGKDHVLIGLAKSGLPASQAIQAFSQARGMVGGLAGLQVESPHLAVTLVRHATATQEANAALARLKMAIQALVQRRYRNTPEIRGVAKSLLPYPNLEFAADKFRALHSAMSQSARDPEALKLTARLMAVPSPPSDIMNLLGMVDAELRRGPLESPQNYLHIMVSLAAEARTPDQVVLVVGRFFEFTKRLAPHVAPAKALLLAADLVSCRGTPDTVLIGVTQLAQRLMQRGMEGPRAFDMACQLGKRLG